jgi:hypothetical protein
VECGFFQNLTKLTSTPPTRAQFQNIFPHSSCDVLNFTEEKNQAVVVTGAKGKPPPNTYKVCGF